MELTAAVAAERDDDQQRLVEARALGVGDDQARERAHEVVHEARMAADGRLARRAVGVHRLEGAYTLGEDSAEELQTKASSVLGPLGPRFSASGPAIKLRGHDGCEGITARPVSGPAASPP